MRRWRISFTAFHKVAHGLLEKEVSQGSLIQFYRSVLNSFLSENRKILRFFGGFEVNQPIFVVVYFNEIWGFQAKEVASRAYFLGFNMPKSLQRTPQGEVVVGRIGCLTKLRFRGVFARRKQEQSKNKKKCDVDNLPYKVGFTLPLQFLLSICCANRHFFSLSAYLIFKGKDKKKK